jgi:hypothetical protein
MADGGSEDKKAFCGQMRRDIGARQKRAFALPNEVEVEMSRRLLKLNKKIDELQEVAPEKAQVARSKYVIIERAITGGNAQTADGPLTQLETVVEQLLNQPQPVQNNNNDQARQPRPARYVPRPQNPQQPQQPAQNPQQPVQNQDQQRARANVGAVPMANRPPIPLRPLKRPQVQPPQNQVQTPQQTFSAAAAQVKVLAGQQADPTLKNAIADRVAQQTAVKTQEMKNLIQSASEDQDENIHRKVFLVFDSKDKQYLDHVQQPCDEVLAKIGEASQKNTTVTADMTKRLELLVPQLEGWRAHYADKTGINPKDTDLLKQRDAKVTAIVKRRQGIQAVLTKAGEICSLQTNEEAGARANRKLELENDGTLDNVIHLAANIAHANDQEAAQDALKDLANFMGNADAVTRQVLLAELPDLNFAVRLVAAAQTGDDDRIVGDLIKAKGADRNALSSMTDAAVVGEISAAPNKQTMLRGNCAASKIAVGAGKGGPSKTYVDAAVNACLSTVLDCEEDLEVKPKGDTQTNQKEWDFYDKNRKEFDRKHAKQLAAHKQLARQTVNQLTQTPVPDELAEVCGTMYTEALKRYKQINPPNGEPKDEKDALAIVGGHIMLRLVNPPLTMAAIDPTLSKEQKEALLQQSKLLQHISNGTKPSVKANSPEFDELVGTANQPSPEALQMQAFFKTTAMKGRRVKAGKQVTLDRVLNNPPSLGPAEAIHASQAMRGSCGVLGIGACRRAGQSAAGVRHVHQWPENDQHRQQERLRSGQFAESQELGQRSLGKRRDGHAQFDDAGHDAKTNPRSDVGSSLSAVRYLDSIGVSRLDRSWQRFDLASD